MIRALTENEVTFELTVEQDDTQVRGNALASGDDEEDRKCEDEILRRLDQGDVWAWASVRVTARWEGFEGHDYLGGCSYESERDFVQSGGYFDDMKDAALAELNQAVQAHAAKLETLRVSS